MLITNGILRCSATCAIADAAPESNGPTSTCAPSLISFSARERATSTLVSVSAFISSMSTPYMSRISAGEMSAPSWQDWPMNACTPERGSSTPTLSFFGCARTIAGAASVLPPTTADAAAIRLKSRRVTCVMVSSLCRVKRRPVGRMLPRIASLNRRSGYHGCPAWSRRTRFRIFPVALLGSSLTMSTRAGTLYAAMLSRQ